MAVIVPQRVAFPLVLQSPVTGSAIVGAKATITKHIAGAAVGGGEAAEIFLAETGASKAASNVIVTDNRGSWTQGEGASYEQYWLPRGTYDITITGTGLTSITITRELVTGQALGYQTGDYRFTANPNTVEEGFAACDGGETSRTGIGAALFALLGTTYGVGNGTSTFNRPDFRERVPVGAGGATVLGAKGGANSAVIGTGEMPVHTHGVNDPTHSHGFGGGATLMNRGEGAGGFGNGPNPFGNSTQTANAGTGITIQNAGAGAARSNMQAYLVCNVWIKL